MTRRITLAIAAVTSDDGTKCAPQCPHYINPADEATSDYEVADQPFCLLLNGRELEWAEDDSGWLRTGDCLATEQEAREAEASAMRAGFSLCEGAPTLMEGFNELRAELARIRGGKSS